MNFLLWFVEQLKNGLCPHCANPAEKVIFRGYSVFSKPCGCELFRVTIENYKVASLDEYRNAKKGYMKQLKSNKNFKMSFPIYCLFRSRYKFHLIAKKKKET